MSWRLGGAVAMLLFLASPDVRADISKGECVDANTQGQALRRKTKFADARKQFQLCVDQACPEVVRTDCIQRLEEIENVFPTIVFDVKNGRGEDISEVTIKIDGNVVSTAADGAAHRADPGPHEVSFLVPGEKEVVRTFVLKEGEKGRRERVVIGEAPPPPVTPPPSVGTGPSGPVDKATTEDGRGQRIGAFVAGGFGLAALGVGTFFGLRASSEAGSQKDACASTANCPDRTKALDAHDDAVSAATVSTVLTIAGGALVIGAVVLYLTAPSGQRSAAVLRQLANGPRITF